MPKKAISPRVGPDSEARVLAAARPQVAVRILQALPGICRSVVVGPAEELFKLCASLAPDLVIVELGQAPLTSLAGFKALRRDPRLRHVPMLALYAAGGGEEALLQASHSGATDCLAEPFEPAELAVRVAELLRRSQGAGAARLKIGALDVDLRSRRARLSGRVLDLTATEILILAALMRFAGAPASKQALAALAWGEERANSHALDCHVSNLRRKLGRLGGMIETVYGGGYRYRC